MYTESTLPLDQLYSALKNYHDQLTLNTCGQGTSHSFPLSEELSPPDQQLLNKLLKDAITLINQNIDIIPIHLRPKDINSQYDNINTHQLDAILSHLYNLNQAGISPKEMPETTDLVKHTNSQNVETTQAIDSVSLGIVANKLTESLYDASKELHKAQGDLYESNQLLGGGRFVHILCPTKSAVHIPFDGEIKPLHANYVTNNYIATQAPKTPEADANSIPAFYFMIWHTQSNTVINLTNTTDAKKSMDLAFTYWPQGTAEHSLAEQSIKVQTDKEEAFDSFTIIHLTLSVPQQGSRKVKLFHFTSWPDFEAPKDDQLDQFLKFSQKVLDHKSNKPTIVHCRAGIGRTGTMITFLRLKEKILSGQCNHDQLNDVVAKLIFDGRKTRGKTFVETENQIKLLLSLGHQEITNKSSQ